MSHRADAVRQVVEGLRERQKSVANDAAYLTAELSMLGYRIAHRSELAALNTARNVLEREPRTCRYHGDQFDKLGMEWGEPRCDSCRQPWRVVRALAEIEQAEKAGAREETS